MKTQKGYSRIVAACLALFAVSYIFQAVQESILWFRIADVVLAILLLNASAFVLFTRNKELESAYEYIDTLEERAANLEKIVNAIETGMRGDD